MNRIRVLFSLTLILAAASLASAGSFGPRIAATADGTVCTDMNTCTVDMSACPGGGPDCCPVPCPLPCEDGSAAATQVAAR